MGNSLDKCCSQPGHVIDSNDLSRSIITVENQNSFLNMANPNKNGRILEDSKEDEESEVKM